MVCQQPDEHSEKQQRKPVLREAGQAEAEYALVGAALEDQHEEALGGTRAEQRPCQPCQADGLEGHARSAWARAVMSPRTRGLCSQLMAEVAFPLR